MDEIETISENSSAKKLIDKNPTPTDVDYVKHWIPLALFVQNIRHFQTLIKLYRNNVW